MQADQMTTLAAAAAKMMTLAQQKECMLCLPCSYCSGTNLNKTCHRVCDLVDDCGYGLSFYATCKAFNRRKRKKEPQDVRVEARALAHRIAYLLLCASGI